MTDKIESKGKTVEDAVNEALLQMGARRDEVNIEVLDEPKAGLFGILGGKRARVLVTRKRSGGRGGRGVRRDGPQDAVAYDLNDKDGGSRRRGGRGRGGQPAARREDGTGGRDQQDGRSRREPREPREAREARDTRAPREPRPAREGGEGRPAREGEGSGRSRRRGGRGRRGGGGGGERRNDAEGNVRNENGATVERAAGNERNQGGGRSSGGERQGGERQGGERQGGDRSGAQRRGGRSRRNRDNNRPDERLQERTSAAEFSGNERPEENIQVNTAAASVEAAAPAAEVREPRQREDGRRDRRSRGRGRGRDERDNPSRDSEPETPETYSARSHDTSNDQIIKADIPAAKYAEPVREVTDEDVDQTLINFTSGMLLRAGFPVRCEVKDGEYRQVRIVTDDSSAGVLIGRHGATVDAVEHLVERMIGMAAGDRVRMNLDINNYRRRREESLHDRVLDAAAMVRENGRTFHMEAMCARERRVVHLEVEKMSGLRTFTMGGAASKHVVIALDNGEPDEQEAVEDNEDDFNVAAADSSEDDFDEFDDGPQPQTNELVVDDDDDLRPLV